MASCPSTVDTPNFSNRFVPGDSFSVMAGFRDQVAGTSTQYRLLRPGHADEAERTATEAIETGEGAIAVRARAIRSAARRALGDVDARSEGEELVTGLNVLERTGYRSIEPLVRTELAELAALLGDREEEQHQRVAVERIRHEMETTAGVST